MKIVNTDGMAFLGPGSEWFWAAFQTLIILATLVYVMRQLGAMRMANALSELREFSERWDSPSMTEARLHAAAKIRDSLDAEMSRPMASIAEFFSDMDSMLHRGVLNENQVMEAWAARCDRWWFLLSPRVGHFRDTKKSANLYKGFQDLAIECQRNAQSWGMSLAGANGDSRAAVAQTLLLDAAATQREQAAPQSLDVEFKRPSGWRGDAAAGSGLIALGANLNETGTIPAPDSCFPAGQPIGWSAAFREPAGATSLRWVIAKRTGAGEKVSWSQPVEISDPTFMIVGMTDDLTPLLDGVGDYVMRYSRASTPLAEGSFSVVHS